MKVAPSWKLAGKCQKNWIGHVFKTRLLTEGHRRKATRKENPWKTKSNDARRLRE